MTKGSRIKSIKEGEIMKNKALWTSGIAFLFLMVLLTIAAPAVNAQGRHVRWDIIVFDSTGTILSPGGSLSATAVDGSQITLTGTGTFVAPASDRGKSNAVTGGGTWAINTPSASGTYKVEGFVRYDEAPGTLAGLGLTDTIGDINDTHAGLGIFSILYSDGERGVLLVSCNLFGTPAIVYEGVSASKGSVNFFDPVLTPSPDATLFHFDE
jgi:hypothetical protein